MAALRDVLDAFHQEHEVVAVLRLRQGAKPTPQLPTTTEVTPWQLDGAPSGSQVICASRWVWTSTKPGVTSLPRASITSPAGPS